LDWIDYSNKIFINISVFWDLYCAAPERRDSFEPTQEAKMFHDFVSKFFINLCGFVFHFIFLTIILNKFIQTNPNMMTVPQENVMSSNMISHNAFVNVSILNILKF